MNTMALARPGCRIGKNACHTGRRDLTMLSYNAPLA